MAAKPCACVCVWLCVWLCGCVCVWLCVCLCVQEFENFLPSQNEGDVAVARAQSKRRRVA